MKILNRISWYLLLATAFVLCLKSVREPDLWWMYKTGDWMIANMQPTYSDSFSYTHEGTNWINVKWLFEVLISILKNLGGAEMVFVLQGLIAFDLMLLMGKTSARIADKQAISKGTSYMAALVFTGILALISMDFRLIGRPEMISHLFTADFLFLFVLWYQKRDTKWIYALITLQMLWTNLHEGFGTGMVLIMAFLAGNWLEYYWRGNVEKPLNLTWASLAALAVVVVNPRGPEMWAHPFNIFTQLSENQYTTELFSYTNPEYWQKEAYLNIVFMLTAAFLLLKNAFSNTPKTIVETNEKAKNKSKNPVKEAVVDNGPWNFGIGYSLILILLFYLSLTAYRNIPFFVIAAAPLMVLGLERIFRYLLYRFKIPEMLLSVKMLVILLVFYVGIVSNQYHKISNSRDEFGLQVLNSHNPVAAAEFIKTNKIQGRCFSDYLVSSYLLWKLPDFKTYIDLRDLDIFPTAFFQRYQILLQDPKIFEEEDKKYGFNYIVLLRRNIESLPFLYKYLQDSPGYEMVFADPVAVIYLKNNNLNKVLIERFGMGEDRKRDIWKLLEAAQSSALPAVINKIFNPFFSNRNYKSVDQEVIAAHLYYTIGAPELGLAYADKSLARKANFRAHEIKALINAQKYFDPKTAADEKERLLQNAMKSFESSLTLNADALESLYGKAVLLMEKQQFSPAAALLQKAQQIAPQNPAIQQKLGECYDKMKVK